MPLQIPHPNTPLHLYRHMLREATYLPPLCRPWIASRIQARFRECRTADDSKYYIKGAHQQLRYLRSANTGHVNRMRRLCYLATGRVGKRRRLLARAELSSLPASSSTELDNRMAKLVNGKRRELDWMDNWSIEKVQAIAFSQSAQQTPGWPHIMRKGVDPLRVLPTENCFGRPVSKKLMRNKLKRHWAAILKQLLPPLPKGEWDQLAAMARGEADPQHYKIPARRPVAISITESPSAISKVRTSSWEDFVTKPVRSLERGSSRTMKSLTGDEDEDPRGHGRPTGIRVLNQRKLRRSIYGNIWKASPLIDKNPRSGKWSVTWGGQGRQPVQRPRKKDLQFFQGIDKAGVPIRSVT
ncbi:Peroxygenase 1 [Hypoxylon texense]